MEDNDVTRDDWWGQHCSSHGVADKPYYSIRETTLLLDCSRSTVSRYCRSGWLQSKPLGPRKRVIPAESIKLMFCEEDDDHEYAE